MLTEERLVLDEQWLGSFTDYILVITYPHYWDWEAHCRKQVTLTSETTPEANGYWNVRGREHKVFLKGKLIAIIYTEDCGLGTAKARKVVLNKGYRIK